ncbi:MAG TPA: hypothetical protein VFI59_01670 [Actinomycetota bacterium]|nr:hypothetical protein [Actinomycetota bacterium]
MADDTVHHSGDPALGDALQRFERAQAELEETEERRQPVQSYAVHRWDAAWLPDGPLQKG